MLKLLRPYRTMLVLMMVAIVLKVLSFKPDWVETAYTYGIYPNLAQAMRWLTGWLRFSFGDLLYAAAGIRVVFFLARSIRSVRKAGWKKTARSSLYQACCALLVVYIWFNAFWGLNYDRQGIAHQLRLPVQEYSLPDVLRLTQTLQTRLNFYAVQTDTVKRKTLDTSTHLFQKAMLVYRAAEKRYPYLHYAIPSIKPSLYSGVGHYFGFTGYYNPFSGEAQLKTSIPVFLKPFVAMHEIAHQLGYARENEANFVAFLSSRQSGDAEVLYSLYYNLYGYALRQVYSRDSVSALALKETLHPQVRRDNEELKAYFKSTKNRIEPLVTRFYDQYLKWNNQRSGVQTYNQVVALLIAYGKKYGWAAI